MLSVTEDAIAWLRENRARHHVPSEYGVRIVERPAGEGIGVRSAPKPELDERTVIRHGLRFFLTGVIAESLKDRIIDAANREAGSGLVIRRRRPAELAGDQPEEKAAAS